MIARIMTEVWLVRFVVKFVNKLKNLFHISSLNNILVLGAQCSTNTNQT